MTTDLELVLPPDPQLLRIVRLVASGLASLAELDLDGVEQVRVSADEVVSTLIEASAGGEVRIKLSIDAEGLRIDASTPLGDGNQLKVDPLVDKVLTSVTTAHEWSTVDGVAHGVARHARSNGS
jgi:hypothetical protein